MIGLLILSLGIAIYFYQPSWLASDQVGYFYNLSPEFIGIGITVGIFGIIESRINTIRDDLDDYRAKVEVLLEAHKATKIFEANLADSRKLSKNLVDVLTEAKRCSYTEPPSDFNSIFELIQEANALDPKFGTIVSRYLDTWLSFWTKTNTDKLQSMTYDDVLQAQSELEALIHKLRNE